MKYKLAQLLEKYSLKNSDNYEPVAVGRYGIRKRSDIYKKELSDDYSKNKVIFKDTLIIGMGSVQIDVGVLTYDAYYSVSPAYHTFKINTKIVLSEFLEALFSFKNYEYTQKYMIASARQGKKVDVDGLLNEYVEIPSIAKQRRIVEINIEIKKVINDSEKQLTLCDELINSRFKEMFDCCKSTAKLSELSTLITKGASPKWQGINYSDQGTLFITSENVREGFIDISNPKYVENKVNDKQPRSVLKKGDILINIVGASIGRAAIFELDVLANINQAVSLVRMKNNINKKYLIRYLNSAKAIEQYRDNAKGGARDNLSLKNIADLIIVVPSLEKQNEFAIYVDIVEDIKNTIKNNLSLLNELFNKTMDEHFGDSDNA